MKSIGVRLTFWYVIGATLGVACLFPIGFHLLESRLIHGLDLLNESEFQQIKGHLGPHYKTLTRGVINERIRQTTNDASTLFYINIDTPKVRRIFISDNLRQRTIPDIPGKHIYNATVSGVGDLRVHEFLYPPFDITVGTPLGPVHALMKGYALVSVALVGAMLLISLAIGAALSRMVLRPVRLIRETASRINSDNLSERIPVAAVHDEISDLAQLLNTMFDRIEVAFKEVRKFSANASHELKTPLSLIRLHAEKMLSRGDLPTASEDDLAVQLEEIARLNEIIDGLLFLSKAEANAIEIDREKRDPGEFVQTFAADAEALCHYHKRRFSCAHEGSGVVSFDARFLRQVLLNLLTNAIKASPPNGRITMRSRLEGNRWSVGVHNEGPSLSAEQREHIFERFVRFDLPGTDNRGSGLGLAICRSIVALHGGSIRAESPARGGLLIEFGLPAGPRPARPAAKATAPPRAQRGSEATR